MRRVRMVRGLGQDRVCHGIRVEARVRVRVKVKS